MRCDPRQLVVVGLFLSLCAPGAAAGGPLISADSRPAALARPSATLRGEYAEGQVLVTLRPGFGLERLSPMPGHAPAARRHEAAFKRLSVIRGRTVASLSVPGATTADLMARYAADPAVERVEPNRRFRLLAAPDDPFLSRQWALDNQGQPLHGVTGLPDADIDAPEAWAAIPSLPALAGTVVAVLDSGIDHTHQDLAGAMWVNPGEIPGNAIDDDGNGWVDDVHGASFTWPYDDTDTLDLDGHGSHVAGIIAARVGDATGMAGIAPNARLMAVRAFSGGSGYIDDIIAGMLYILEMKTRFDVNIVAVNASFGGSGNGDDDLMAEVVEALGDAGIIFVASAGNDGLDMDHPDNWPNVPAGYTSPAIVSVAASTSRDELASWSSRGVVSVDLAAPGSAILSTVPGGASSVIFSDDFESGMDGWTHGGTNDFWALTTEDSWSGSHGVADSPGEFFLPGTDAFLALNGDLDLSSYSGQVVRVTFWARISIRDNYASGDMLLVEASGNGGQDWQSIAHYITGQQLDWQTYQATLPEFLKTASFRVRFRLKTTSVSRNLDGVILDDIAIGVADAGSNGYALWSGTSMAAPHVAGAVALLAGRFPDDDLATRIDRLLSGTDRLPGLGGLVLSSGRLNLARSLDPALPLRPLVASVSPREGLREGTTVVLDGRHFGEEPGRVIFADAPWPGWGTGDDLRVRFHLTVSGYPNWTDSWTNVWLDDIRLTAGSVDLFSDDLELGGGNWVHGGTFDSWALSGENAHSPTMAWSDNPALGALTDGDSWLMPDRVFDRDPSGRNFLSLSFWSEIELGTRLERLSPEVSDDGLAWHPLDFMNTTNTGFLTLQNWMRFGYSIPRPPQDAAIIFWSDTAITARVPAGAGRFLQVARPDGESSNMPASSAWITERVPSRTRAMAAAAGLGGRIYLAGGQVDYNDLDPFPEDWRTNALEIFDPATGWRTGPPMANPRSSPAAVAAGGRIYVIGGYGLAPSGYDPELFFSERVGYVESFDPRTGSWKSRAPLPEPAEALASAVIGTTIYVSGGYGNVYGAGSLDSLWAYDRIANRWTRKAPMRAPRAWHVMAAVDGRLLVFGGTDGKGLLLDSAESYDPATDSWSPLPNLPFVRYAMAGVTDGKLVYLTGGRDADGRFSFLVFDPATGLYEDRDAASERMPVSRTAHNLVLLPGFGLYALGGVEVTGWSWAPGMERLPAETGRRLTILSPTQGESIPSGSSTIIAWRGTAGAHHYSLDLSLDNGRTWRRLGSAIKKETFRWRAPKPLRNLARCKVRVTAFDAGGRRLAVAVSPSAFSVDALAVPVPVYWGNGSGGPPCMIPWDTHEVRRPAASTEVSLSLDGGKTWSELATLEGNPGICPWDYPYGTVADGEMGRVRVRLRDGQGIIAEGVSPRFTDLRF